MHPKAGDRSGGWGCWGMVVVGRVLYVNAPKDPLNAPQDPFKAPQDTLNAPQDPSNAPLDPLNASQDPLNAPQDPLNPPQDPLNAPHDPSPLQNSVMAVVAAPDVLCEGSPVHHPGTTRAPPVHHPGTTRAPPGMLIIRATSLFAQSPFSAGFRPSVVHDPLGNPPPPLGVHPPVQRRSKN